MPRRKPTPKTHELKAFGYEFSAGPTGTVVHRPTIDTRSTEDYGADPLGDGRFRMVPSGDIVDFEERNRRLARFKTRRGDRRRTRHGR
jgi:hypothetical protein